jgi:hypothetical protein
MYAVCSSVTGSHRVVISAANRQSINANNLQRAKLKYIISLQSAAHTSMAAPITALLIAVKETQSKRACKKTEFIVK